MSATLTTDEIERIRQAVIEAQHLAYTPYSKFNVGAALLLNDGSIVKGANVENASYPAAVCAERVAIPRALMEGHSPSSFKALAVITDSKILSAPCGICRQVIREFAPKLPIFMFSTNGDYKESNLEELLPFSFGPESLDTM